MRRLTRRASSTSMFRVAETVAMCVYMGGGPALMYGAKAMAAFDQLAKND